MKLVKNHCCSKSKKLNLFVLTFITIILNSNCFKFTTEADDLIIKFNIENLKFQNNDYVSKVKNIVKKEMKIFKNKLSYMKIPDDLDVDSPVKIYEIQNNSNSNNTSDFNDNSYEGEEDNGVNEFEEKDMIRSKIMLVLLLLLLLLFWSRFFLLFIFYFVQLKNAYLELKNK